MNVLDLFSGIGGFSLGLERAGMRTVAFCEIDPYCRAVLRKHWPHVPIYADVRTLTAERLSADGISVDVICGGFPCQDISIAGRGEGITGPRSGLWREFRRLIAELSPRFILIENVPELVRRGLGRVLSDLSALGYDAEWDCVGADELGASQHRRRIWVLAYPHNPRLQGPIWAREPDSPRAWRPPACREPLRSDRGYWPPGPRAVADIPRMADGPAHRVDRLRALGNTVIPQIPEIIGRAIMSTFEKESGDADA